MSKLLRWSVVLIVASFILLILVRNHYVLDSQSPETAINAELPTGTSKTKVIQFVTNRQPLFCDDLGEHVKARLAGRAGNLIYRKDIVIDFKFGPDGKLLAWSKKEYLSFV